MLSKYSKPFWIERLQIGIHDRRAQSGFQQTPFLYSFRDSVEVHLTFTSSLVKLRAKGKGWRGFAGAELHKYIHIRSQGSEREEPRIPPLLSAEPSASSLLGADALLQCTTSQVRRMSAAFSEGGALCMGRQAFYGQTSQGTMRSRDSIIFVYVEIRATIRLLHCEQSVAVQVVSDKVRQPARITVGRKHST